MELDDKCKEILIKMSDSTLHYHELVDLTGFNDTTLSRHLNHLLEKQIIININKRYQKNRSNQKFPTTPYTITNIKMELEIKKRDSDFEYLHYKITRSIRNEMTRPLISISSYFGDESVGHRWQDLNIKYYMLKDNKQIPLYDSLKKPAYFYEDSPHMKKFRVDFPNYPIKPNETRTFFYEREWKTKITNTKFVYDPIVHAANIEFSLTWNTKLDYELSVYEVDKYTYEIQPSVITPTKIKNGKGFTWLSDSLLPHLCLEFRRQIID